MTEKGDRERGGGELCCRGSLLLPLCGFCRQNSGRQAVLTQPRFFLLSYLTYARMVIKKNSTQYGLSLPLAQLYVSNALKTDQKGNGPSDWARLGQTGLRCSFTSAVLTPYIRRVVKEVPPLFPLSSSWPMHGVRSCVSLSLGQKAGDSAQWVKCLQLMV